MRDSRVCLEQKYVNGTHKGGETVNENRIGSERVRMRVSQNELAKYLGVSNKTVSQWEQNNRKCPAERIVALSDYFGCTTDYLLSLTNERVNRRVS